MFSYFLLIALDNIIKAAHPNHIKIIVVSIVKPFWGERGNRTLITEATTLPISPNNRAPTAMEPMRGFEPPSGAYKAPAKPTQLHRLKFYFPHIYQSKILSQNSIKISLHLILYPFKLNLWQHNISIFFKCVFIWH
jgi:hypothetical protein